MLDEQGGIVEAYIDEDDVLKDDCQVFLQLLVLSIIVAVLTVFVALLSWAASLISPPLRRSTLPLWIPTIVHWLLWFLSGRWSSLLSFPKRSYFNNTLS